MNQFFSWMIFINNFIFILTGSLGKYFSLLYMSQTKRGGTIIIQLSQRNGKLPLEET